MKLTYRKILVGALVVLTSACAKKEEESSVTADTLADSAEAGLQVAGGIADDQAGSSFAMRTPHRPTPSMILEALISPAFAANCGRAVAQACNTTDGTKSISYSSCAVGSIGQFTLNGSVNLDYSSNSCTLNIGENVLRTYDWTISGPRGRSIQNTSANRNNYLGASIGGGGRLSRTASAEWQIEVLGKHKIATNARGTLMDVSVKTASPLQVTGSLSRSGRVISSGQLDVHHNLAQFTASFVPNNLTYSASCCYPVSGSMTVNYSGSQSGSATIEFLSCGSATLTKDGVARSVELSYCE